MDRTYQLVYKCADIREFDLMNGCLKNYEGLKILLKLKARIFLYYNLDDTNKNIWKSSETAKFLTIRFILAVLNMIQL